MALRPSLTSRYPAADQSVKLWSLLTHLRVSQALIPWIHYAGALCSLIVNSYFPPSLGEPPPLMMSFDIHCLSAFGRQSQGKCSHTFGALDAVQVVQMAPHVSTIYVSGWQCSSTASTR